MLKLEYKRNLNGSINKVIEYKCDQRIFKKFDLIKINDIVDKVFLIENNITYIEQEHCTIPIGIIGDSSNYIRFYVVNDNKPVDKIISFIEKSIEIEKKAYVI